MPLLVVLDANIVLAACLDPRMDAKGGMAAEVLGTLQQEEFRAVVTDGIQKEIERKLHERIGQILDEIRILANEPPTFPFNPSQPGSEVVEGIFATLRRKTEGAAGAIQLLETRLAPAFGNIAIASAAQWRDIMNRIAVEVTAMLTEVQKRQDALGLEVVARAGKVDQDKFRPFVATPDLEHVAVLAAISEARRTVVLFVTMDGRLHGSRDDIRREAPNLIVTTPAHVPRQIARLRAK